VSFLQQLFLERSGAVYFLYLNFSSFGGLVARSFLYFTSAAEGRGSEKAAFSGSSFGGLGFDVRSLSLRRRRCLSSSSVTIGFKYESIVAVERLYF